MARFLRPLVSTAVTLVTAGLVVSACSSDNGDDGSLASTGGSSATGGSGGSSSGAKGGTGTGGSSTGGSSATGGSSTGGSSATGGSSTGGTGTGGTGTGGSSGGNGGSGAYPTDACEGFAFDANGQGGEGGDSACTGVSTEAESVPVDLFIMMDRSVSMGNPVPGTGMTRWQALQQAVEEFASSSNGDIRAGIGFFGVTGGQDDEIDCDTSRYAKPVVEIGDLADVGDDLVAAMNKMKPGGLTPAGPALAGALEYASSWAEDNVGRATAVVLVSDGYPTQCQPQAVSALADMAEMAHKNAPFVRTYVIGLGGDFNLDAIALSGGTHAAFLVDEGDFASSFTKALGNVTNTKLACEYALPPAPDGNQDLDLDKVQVTYTSADDSTEEIPSLTGINGCANSANGGWYYDDPQNPTSILVCPCTCSRFEAGSVDVRVGCRPRIGPR
jgi:hypothetical protein